MMSASDTIYSLSSGGLPAGVAVVRVSGSRVMAVAEEICGLPDPRLASLRTIRNRNGQAIDQALVLFFPGPASFTGEDCLELQLHGGRAVVNAALETLSSFPGLRHAEAGEFSRRAFQNGKLDLLEVEGLADLIAAETEMQRQLASQQARGHVSALYERWALRLTHSRAMIEAELDFADEDDVPGSVSSGVWDDVKKLMGEIESHLTGARTGAVIRDGFKIVISGPPNVGKSSLLNALARKDIAIVTDIAGTTRDIISVDISLAGFAVTLSDTAGLRETDDPVEREGIRRARQEIAQADLVLFLSDMPEPFRQMEPRQGERLNVRTKVDQNMHSWDSVTIDVAISTRLPNGLDDLLEQIELRLPQVDSVSALALPSRKRHADHLKQCLKALESTGEVRDRLDLQAEFLRQAASSLGRITGSTDVEDLLDVIFSEFCIGK